MTKDIYLNVVLRVSDDADILKLMNSLAFRIYLKEEVSGVMVEDAQSKLVSRVSMPAAFASEIDPRGGAF